MKTSFQSKIENMILNYLFKDKFFKLLYYIFKCNDNTNQINLNSLLEINVGEFFNKSKTISILEFSYNCYFRVTGIVARMCGTKKYKVHFNRYLIDI